MIYCVQTVRPPHLGYNSSDRYKSYMYTIQHLDMKTFE